MKDEHLLTQTVAHHQQKKQEKREGTKLSWWQLSLIGIGSVIGAGFFLGTGLSIKTAGPSILIDYMIAGVTAYFVFSALAEMITNDPQKGTFRIYAKKAFGHSFGFVSGWMYWLSGILIMSSEIVALSTFTKFWFPHVPLWIFSILYAVLGFGINLLGASNFGKIESVFAVIKLSTLLIFIVFGALLLFHIITPSELQSAKNAGISPFMPMGIKGTWAALIFVFFSFGGIAVLGIASNELRDKKDVPKAGKGTLFSLVTVYVLSLFFVMSMVSWTKINESESPFVTALSAYHIPFLDSIFNIIIISAAFSTMVGALFSITNVMISLAVDGDAPKGFAEKNDRGVAVKSLMITAIGLGISILFSFLLPNEVYEYITTAAGVMLILNWVIILVSHIKLHPSYDASNGKFKMFGYPFTSYLGIALILLAISGAMVHANQRIGLFISLGLICVIYLSYWGVFRSGHKGH
ncbi:amino acid permease [Rossellomorea vietnamensis]|uniref:amino acid permease n=1 Tax=Rossellomorea vietnamensis TaxID=218284 RepID=UPI001E59C234|nr:amino acid permease [Rossellomorea vietnamensis]MCC5800954.1 amino acid permease [Rossellomorea vietnamensis]